MTDETKLKSLLIEFADSHFLPLVSAAHAAFGIVDRKTLPRLVKDAVRLGYLVSSEFGKTIEDHPSLYSREFQLTDEGREFCGLPRLVIEAPKESNKQLEMF